METSVHVAFFHLINCLLRLWDNNASMMHTREIRQSLSSRTNVTFFDSSGVLCHGLSDSVIESIVDNSHKIFGVSDLMEHSFVSSLQLAVMIIEIFIELFEDITHDSNLHSLAAETEPMYNELIDNIQVPDIELHPDQMSDSDD